MSRIFTRGTALYEMEVMMVQIPNFTKRKLKESLSCRYCTGYSKRLGCKAEGCPYIAERIEVGILDYRGLLGETYGKKIHATHHLMDRINALSSGRSMFANAEHNRRFYSTLTQVKAIVGNPSNCYLSALYLLTAHSRLWSLVKDEVYAREIYFDEVKLHDIDTECYTYYQMARMLYDGISRITVSEMTDQELIPDEVFKVLIHASLILIYGIDTLLF